MHLRPISHVVCSRVPCVLDLVRGTVPLRYEGGRATYTMVYVHINKPFHFIPALPTVRSTSKNFYNLTVVGLYGVLTFVVLLRLFAAPEAQKLDAVLGPPT
jgi:hypothetical protein